MKEYRKKADSWGGHIPTLLEEMYKDAVRSEPGETTYLEVNDVLIIMTKERD